MTPVMAALWSVSALLGVPLLAALTWRWFAARRLVYGACLGICLVVFAVALAYLVDAASAPSLLRLPLGLPWIGAHFRIDALAAFFLVVANLGGAAASLFAIGYGQHEKAPGRVLPFYAAFLAGMNLVVLADDAFTFLLGWEFMSLSSWALVMAHHQDPENRRAGYIYIVMASFGTLCLLLAFGLLAGGSGGYAFAEMRGSPPGLPGLVLILVLLGAGSKAGLVPLHVWLPLAHPAAPSHVSALMSGVMTKVAVYGFIRIVFDLNGPPAWWWSMVVIPLAGITCVLGVLSALMQHDLKRLLAYHTVENIGIIFIGLGLALAFSAHNMPAPAALAMTAALFHVFNHSLFKSLLFFGAGAVLTATGERDMEHLGGLIGRMPLTAFTFLTGCMAISALPPLNGFVSEWLTFQAILLSPDVPSWGIKLIVPAVGAMLALSAALAAACFVKAFGVTFLGRARTPAALAAQDADRCVARAPCSLLPPYAWSPASSRASSSMDWHPSCKASSAAACPLKPPLRGCRSCLLPRAAVPITGYWSSPSSQSQHWPRWRLSIVLLRAPRAAARPGIAAFPTRARPLNTPPIVLPSRYGACLEKWYSWPASASTCRCPVTRGPPD